MAFFQRKTLSVIGFLGALSVTQMAFPLGEGWVVRVKNSGDESTLGTLGFALEKALDSDHRTFKIRSKSHTALKQFYAMSGADTTNAQTHEVLNQLDFIERAEPNYIYRASSGARPPVDSGPGGGGETPLQPKYPLNFPEVLPNDPYFGSLWGLRNRGQTIDFGSGPGVAGADIHATGAWVYEKGSAQVVVAVVDTGIDLTHEDLVDNLWSSGSGSSKINGYNAIQTANPPQDDNGHGTHVSGTIGASGGNGIGVTGINWKVSLMAVKVLDNTGQGDLSTITAGVNWAVDHGAQIINASWGGSGSSQILQDAIQNASDHNVLFVTAAGNDGANNDTTPSYPADYPIANLISVGATDNLDQLADFSNYGTRSVQIAAPGVAIISTLPGSKYGEESGTSMATPHVAGAAALLLAHHPNMSAADLKSVLLQTADHIPALQGKIGNSGARLNVLNAILH